MKKKESFLEIFSLNFLLDIHFKIQRINVSLHSFVHDIWEYNKTLSKRKPNQMRQSLRIDYFFDNSISDLDSSYVSLLNCYKTEERDFVEYNNNSNDNFKCVCHKKLQRQKGTTECKTIFHNVFCVSSWQNSNVPYRNYLTSKNICTSIPEVINYSANKYNLDSPSLSSNTVVEDSTTFYSSVSAVVSNLKSSISPKLKQLLKIAKIYCKILHKDKKLYCYRDIEILHSPATYIQQQKSSLQIYCTFTEKNISVS